MRHSGSSASDGSHAPWHAAPRDSGCTCSTTRVTRRALQGGWTTWTATPGRSDIVSLHVPLTDATRGLIDRRRLALLKPTAVLVNTARGAVVQEDVLVDALEAGELFAAGLDVYDGEPAVSERLLSAPRTVLLPHIGSATLRTRRAMLEAAAEQVRSFFAACGS